MNEIICSMLPAPSNAIRCAAIVLGPVGKEAYKNGLS